MTQSYDESGNLTRMVTPAGFEIRRSYDADDRLTEERTLDKKNGIDRKIQSVYDAAGKVTSEIVQGAEGESYQSSCQYDLSDRLTQRLLEVCGIS